ncbi:hypothetical protein BPUM_2791 [Bacillus pumilus SAFR-032]|uniref:Uncharacterized protein n=1 Tax=Bacillus pumilus (strain SAFR-032) TaxID=315750 RepID=A8FGS9_BACP2|nr:hypothetical protein BPUM_2791 [Bacillus pumilus SAFR-032]
MQGAWARNQFVEINKKASFLFEKHENNMNLSDI